MNDTESGFDHHHHHHHHHHHPNRMKKQTLELTHLLPHKEDDQAAASTQGFRPQLRASFGSLK
jgi:hypothetical protein